MTWKANTLLMWVCFSYFQLKTVKNFKYTFVNTNILTCLCVYNFILTHSYFSDRKMFLFLIVTCTEYINNFLFNLRTYVCLLFYILFNTYNVLKVLFIFFIFLTNGRIARKFLIIIYGNSRDFPKPIPYLEPMLTQLYGALVVLVIEWNQIDFWFKSNRITLPSYTIYIYNQ